MTSLGVGIFSPLKDRLRAEGFLHVTGLMALDRRGNCLENPIQAGEHEFGHWCTSDGRTVVVTIEGEVWIRDGIADKDILTEVCPKGSVAFLPCSRGETIPFHHVLGRIANPRHDFDGDFPADPKPRG